MSGSQTLTQGLPVLTQGTVREARARDSASAEAGAEGGAFQEVLSDLAEGSDAAAADRPTRRGVRDDTGADSGSVLTFLKKAMAETEPDLDGQNAPAAADGAEIAPSVQGAALLLTPAMPAAGGPAAAEGEATVSRSVAELLEQTIATADDQAEAGAMPAGEPAPKSTIGADMSAVAKGRVPKEVSLDMASMLAKPATGAEAVPSAQELSVTLSVRGKETHFAPVPSGAVALGALADGLARAAGVPSDANASAPAVADDGEVMASAAALAAGAEDTAPPVGARAVSRLGGDPGGAPPDQGRSFGGDPADSAELRTGDQKALRASGDAFLAVDRGAAMSGTPVMSQIAGRIAAELALDRPSLPAAAPRVESLPATGPAGSVLKVLHLKLEPADLGSVTVRVDLKDNVISLHLEASHPETARAIARDHEMLSNALKSAGYLVDGITSQTAEPARAQVVMAASADAQAGLSSSPQSQSGMAQARGQNGGQPRDPQGNGFGPGSGVNESREEGAQRVRGALYV